MELLDRTGLKAGRIQTAIFVLTEVAPLKRENVCLAVSRPVLSGSLE